MSATIHILNGDSTLYPLQKSGLNGSHIIWRELLCDGPLAKDVGSDEFWMLRYEFFEKKLKADKLEYYDKTIKELIVIEDLSAYKEVVFWFEYDLFCQVNLLALCSYLLKHYKKDISYYLICVGNEKGKKGWQTLADFSPGEYKELYENKTKLSRNDFLFTDECWKIFVEGNIEDIKNHKFNKNNKFKYLDTAIKQHVKNRKRTNGLDQITYKILKVIESGANTKNDIIRELLIWQHKETVNGFGDSQYTIRLDDLKDYYDVKDDKYYLNKNGQEVLRK